MRNCRVVAYKVKGSQEKKIKSFDPQVNYREIVYLCESKIKITYNYITCLQYQCLS